MTGGAEVCVATSSCTPSSSAGCFNDQDGDSRSHNLADICQLAAITFDAQDGVCAVVLNHVNNVVLTGTSKGTTCQDKD